MSDDALHLPTPAPRRPVHLRRIHCEGFARDDGMYDIEGTLIDTQPRPLRLPHREVPAGDAIHHMKVRLTIDGDRVIHDANARMVETPYVTCGEVAPAYRQLIGLRIESGFNERVKRLFRGTAGCSHVTELLPAMATTAFQVLWSEPEGIGAPGDAGAAAQRGSPLGRCHGLRLDGPIVQEHFLHLVPNGAQPTPITPESQR